MPPRKVVSRPITESADITALRTKMVEEAEKIALEALPAAMRVLARSVAPEKDSLPPTREELSAANSIIQQVMGRPGQKAPPAEEDKTSEFLRRHRDLRARTPVVHTESGGVRSVVAEPIDTV